MRLPRAKSEVQGCRPNVRRSERLARSATRISRQNSASRDGNVLPCDPCCAWRRRPDPKGGLELLASTGSDTVLQPAEIAQVIDFSKHLPDKFASITDDEGNPAPADVEFGFVDGDLRLFQLRPFLDSKMARGISYLQQMDSRLKNTHTIEVDMKGVPTS